MLDWFKSKGQAYDRGWGIHYQPLHRIPSYELVQNTFLVQIFEEKTIREVFFRTKQVSRAKRISHIPQKMSRGPLAYNLVVGYAL